VLLSFYLKNELFTRHDGPVSRARPRRARAQLRAMGGAQFRRGQRLRAPAPRGSFGKESEILKNAPEYWFFLLLLF